MSHRRLCLDVLRELSRSDDQVDLIGALRRVRFDEIGLPAHWIVSETELKILVATRTEMREVWRLNELPVLVSDGGLHLFSSDRQSPCDVLGPDEIDGLRRMNLSVARNPAQEYYNAVNTVWKRHVGTPDVLDQTLDKTKLICIPYGLHGNCYQFSSRQISKEDLRAAAIIAAKRQSLTVEFAEEMSPRPWQYFE